MTRILLLEDNTDMLAMLTQVLEWGGHDVIMGRDGRDGMEILEGNGLPPTIILSDLSMPDMDGLEFLYYVRSTPEYANMPYVIMSAHSSPEDRQNAMSAGADDFLVKPFNLDDFQKVLQRWEITG
jgi:CheY-like chemotaxis protein